MFKTKRAKRENRLLKTQQYCLSYCLGAGEQGTETLFYYSLPRRYSIMHYELVGRWSPCPVLQQPANYLQHSGNKGVSKLAYPLLISHGSIKSEVDREEKYDFCIVVWKQYIIFVP